MLNPDKQNTPQNILSAWTALEVLSPQSFKHPEELAGGNPELVASLEKDKLPWEIPAEDIPDKILYYQVILGTINLGSAYLKLFDLYADSRVDKPNIKGEAILAAVVVDKNGCMIDDSLPVISSFAWGVPQALKGDLNELDKWIQAEKSIIEGLDQILRQKDEKDDRAQLSRSDLDRAYDYLITSLDLTADLVKKNQFAIKSYMYFKMPQPPKIPELPKPPEPLLLNSFFLGDLAYASELFSTNRATKNLKKYLGVDAPQERHDLLRDNVALEKAIAPGLIPPARWPGAGRHPLSLLQQAAVNLTMHKLKDDGILAVNGPPGTGKTTLLRDIVSALVTERAEVMCTYDDPQKAFAHSGQSLKAGSAWLSMHRLDDQLKGFEMLIASSNNKAVENVSAELPALNAITQDASDLRYFTTLSDKLLDRNSWGLIAAVLGNAANHFKFRQTFWWDMDVGLSTYLAEVAGTPQEIDVIDPKTNKVIGTRKPKIIVAEQPPVSHEEALRIWRKTKHQFQKILNGSRSELAKLEEIRQYSSQLTALLQTISEIKKKLEKANLVRDGIVKEQEAAETELTRSKQNLQETEFCLSNHQYLKPNWFKLLFNLGNTKLWRKQNSNFQVENSIAKKCHNEQINLVNNIEIKLNKEQLFIRENERYLQDVQQNYTIIEEKTTEAQTKLGRCFIDEDFFSLSHKDKHLVSPWCEAHVHRLRDDVFIAAIKVHKAFIDAAAKPLRHNLGALMWVFSGNSMSDAAKQELLTDLWSSLFLVVPSVSTTFASVEKMLRSLPPESLGWLLIDEAGQALPQAAVGAILRTKRAVMVGDPVQIEPVVVLPETLTRAICKHFDVDADRFNASEASVQTLADAATPYYAEFEGKYGSRVVGIPLLVHRRCAEPMFGISNAIGYERLMIQAKQEGASAIRNCLGTSAWIDIQGQAQEKWCPEEGDKVLELLQLLKSASTVPDLYIVTPFVIVSVNLRRLIKDSKVMQGWVDNPSRWVSERIGTVHTVQGREAEAVIFVLGAPAANQNGARSWAGGRPNLLNVAVTRAKEVLYIIGNRDLWSNAGLFSQAAKRLN